MRKGRKVRKSSSEETESAKAGGKQSLCEAVGIKVSKCDVTRTKVARKRRAAAGRTEDEIFALTY